MTGDGDFHWYWGHGEAPTQFTGPFDSGDLAMANARAAQAVDGFTIVEADRLVLDHNIFVAADVLALFTACNPQGSALTVPLTEGETEDLEHKLSDCLGRWLRKHGLDRGDGLHQVRARDYFPATAPTQERAP